MHVNGKIHWAHTVSSKRATYIFIHRNRGGSAINDNKVLSGYEGILVHEGWKSYFKNKARHALSNAHHLRELKGLIENEKREWAQL